MVGAVFQDGNSRETNRTSPPSSKQLAANPMNDKRKLSTKTTTAWEKRNRSNMRNIIVIHASCNTLPMS